MQQSTNTESMLGPYRVLDLTDEKGFLCGKILGDLGADVIKIERPGGDPSRNIGPFYHDIPDPEKSLFWFAFNANKRGITLNIETADGRDIFKRLARTADFIIESFPPGHMERLGLGYQHLKEVNRRIILASITPFGQAGPYQDYKGYDIVCAAVGGQLYNYGDPDRAPVLIGGGPQTYLLGGAQAAVAAIIAHYHRELTNEGQHIDISIQECIPWLHIGQGCMQWEGDRTLTPRLGVFFRRTDTGRLMRFIWRCKDGWVVWAMNFGLMGHLTQKLVKWMEDEGMADELKSIDWYNLDLSKYTEEGMNNLNGHFARFFEAHTKAELYQGSIERGTPVYPVSTPGEPQQDIQLQSRQFWVKLWHAELGTSINYPGPFVQASEAPCRVRRCAPLIGEHNHEVYERELGLSKEEMTILKQAGHI